MVYDLLTVCGKELNIYLTLGFPAAKHIPRRGNSNGLFARMLSDPVITKLAGYKNTALIAKKLIGEDIAPESHIEVDYDGKELVARVK